MSFIETKFPNLIIFEPTVFEDNRGYFFESYHYDLFRESGVAAQFVQDNQARSTYGVIRGLHFQKPPFAQAKLIRVISGEIIDAVVDLRVGSPTYGQSYQIKLSDSNKKQLFVPKGFAHGYSVLSRQAEMLYKCDTFYHKESEGGIRFDDEELEIDWGIPFKQIILSEKDRQWPLLKGFQSPFVFEE